MEEAAQPSHDKQPIVNVTVHPNITIEPKITVEPSKVEFPAVDNKEAKRANRYALFGILINALLFLITLSALAVTCQSVEIANEALKDSRQNQKIADERKRIDDSTSHVKDSLNYNVDTSSLGTSQKSLNAQVNSIKETENQFQIDNEPILEVVTTAYPILKENQESSIAIDVFNLGKYPCRILDMIILTAYKIAPPNFKEVYTLGKNHVAGLNEYITNQKNIHETILVPKIFSKSHIESLQSGQYSIYLWGTIKYQNLVTKKMKEYNFIIKYFYVPGYTDAMTGEFLLNKNFNLK